MVDYIKMATSMAGSFDVWLTEKLTSLSPEFDTDVFVSYIVSMLDTESSEEEIAESIDDILSQVLGEEQIEAAREEIVEKWKLHNKNMKDAAASAIKKDAGDMLSEIMVSQSLATMKEVKLTDEERANKQAILAQYAQVSDGEDSEEEETEAATVAMLERNSNAALVFEAQKAQREISKQEHEKKKEKDKQDREAQKQKQQQRKDKEKTRTQKQERHR